MIDFGKSLNNFNLKSIDGNFNLHKILQLKDLNVEGFSQQIILFTTNFQKNYQHVFFLNIDDMSCKQLEIEFFMPVFLLRYLVYDYRQLIYSNDSIARHKFIKCLLKQQQKKKMQFNTRVKQSMQNINQYIFLTYTDSFIRFYTKHNLKLFRKSRILSDSITCIKNQLLVRRQNQIKVYHLPSMQKVRTWIYNGEERIFQQCLNNKNQLFLRTYSYENGQKLINLENGQDFSLSIDQQITNSQLWYLTHEILNITLLPDLNIEFQLDLTNIDSLSLKTFQEGDITIMSLRSNDLVHIYKFYNKY